jgi:palmitoyltransferase
VDPLNTIGWLLTEIPCFLIAFAGYGTYLFILVPHHDSPLQLIWFQFSLLMTWLSYYLAITVSPGSPKTGFEPFNGEWKRWCVKCNAYKPERSHHCRQCKRCVLKMDHHCPWTYNCVGHNNMPHFIRFLVWVLISTSYAFYHLCCRAMDLYSMRSLPAVSSSTGCPVFCLTIVSCRQIGDCFHGDSSSRCVFCTIHYFLTRITIGHEHI